MSVEAVHTELSPDPVLRKRLQKKCVTSGVSWADVRWDPIAGKLAILCMDKSGEWHPLRHLCSEDGEPRQINNDDIEKTWRTGHGNGFTDDMKRNAEKFEASKRRWEDERKYRFEKATRDGYKALTSKTWMGGDQIGGVRDSGPTDGGGWCPHKVPYWDCLKCHEDSLPVRSYVSGDSYKIVDRRRFK